MRSLSARHVQGAERLVEYPVEVQRRYWISTLGCPKNEVDSAKLVGTLLDEGMSAATSAEDADLIVVNTCAFVEEARRESIDAILELADLRREGARLVVTGCMAERYGSEVADALPEVDQVSGFGVPVTLGATRHGADDSGPSELVPQRDLLELPRPPSTAPWAYVKVAEGCDRRCGFCAIPSFRGPQRSRSLGSILDEVERLEVSEVVLVAQDLASYGRDQGVGERSIVRLIEEVSERVDWVRLLYLYPSDLTGALIDAILATGVSYFDLSLQHVSAPLLRRMRRWGSGDRFLERIEYIRTLDASAAFRSNFIVGYPGETEQDHDELLRFVEAADLDWCGFFAYSAEEGTYATTLDGTVPLALVDERLGELTELQDRITSRKRDELIGQTMRVLVEAPGQGRSHREAPRIDGVITLSPSPAVGSFVEAEIEAAVGPDLVGRPLGDSAAVRSMTIGVKP